MKIKIICIFVCMLIISTTLVSATKIYKEENIDPMSYETDVPVWVKGNSWTYEINQTTRADPEENVKTFLTGDIILTVVNDTGDYYTLEGVGKSLSQTGNYGRLGLKSSRIWNFNIDLVVRKSDLAVSSYYQIFKGIAFLKIGLFIIIPFPIQMGGYRNSEFSPERPLLPFPLYDGKNGTFNSVMANEEWGATMFWGLITLDAGSDTWSTGTVDYTCTADQVNVPAGNFDVYQVHLQEYANYLYLYYNETVGNIVRLSHRQYSAEFQDWWLLQTLKLKSTTYTPIN